MTDAQSSAAQPAAASPAPAAASAAATPVAASQPVAQKTVVSRLRIDSGIGAVKYQSSTFPITDLSVTSLQIY